MLVDDAGNDAVVLARAAGTAAVTFALAVLSAEGVVYALTEPGAVVASHLFVCKSFPDFAGTAGEIPVNSYNRPYERASGRRSTSPAVVAAVSRCARP